jgi:hypothetical protein
MGRSARHGLVPTREALPCSALLRRRHPIGASDRFGCNHADLADISADGLAGDGRLGPVGALRIRQYNIGR